MNFVCNLVDHVIFYCLQSSVGRAVTNIATETSHAVAEVVQPDVAIVSIRDAPILVLYRTTGIEPIPAFLMVSANTVVCLHIIDHKDISIAELKITVGHQPISNHNYSFRRSCKHIRPLFRLLDRPSPYITSSCNCSVD